MYPLKRPRPYQPLQLVTQIGRSESRLIYVPGVFLLLRMWGTIQFVYSLGVSEQNENGCILNSVWSGFILLKVLQVEWVLQKYSCTFSWCDYLLCSDSQSNLYSIHPNRLVIPLLIMYPLIFSPVSHNHYLIPLSLLVLPYTAGNWWSRPRLG